MVISIGLSVENLIAADNSNPSGPFSDIDSKAKLWKKKRELLFKMRR
jgi:hypothetical protein